MLWTIILTSAVVSAVISLLGSFWLKKIDFNYDYRRYILEKRKLAYSEAEIIINELLIKSKYSIDTNQNSTKEDHDDFLKEIDFMMSRIKLATFYEKVTHLLNNSFWYTDEFYERIIELQALISFYLNEYTSLQGIRVESGLSSKFMHLEEIDLIYKRLSAQFLTDIKNLKSVSFLKKTI